jgi:Transposase
MRSGGPWMDRLMRESSDFGTLEMLWGERRENGIIVAATEPTECPMPQPNDLSRSLAALDENSTLIAVIEMSQSSWLVAGIILGVERHPAKKLNPDAAGLLQLLHRWRGEAKNAGRNTNRIAVAFEAGRDGFWLARWLRAQAIEAYVIHPNSIAVSREHRRAKTDRLDTALLKRAFLGWLRGEREHCSMAAIPSLEEEDAKRPSRERENLVGERTRIGNRIKSTLARLGIRGFKPTLRTPAQQLERLRGGRVDSAQHLGRAAAPDVAIAPDRRADPGDRDGAPRTAGTTAKPWCPSDDPVTSGGSWPRHRDRRYARPRALLAQFARPPGGGALWRANRRAGGERGAPAREEIDQACPWQRTGGRQHPCAARHDPAGLALSDVSERQRPGAVVPNPHYRRATPPARR